MILQSFQMLWNSGKMRSCMLRTHCVHYVLSCPCWKERWQWKKCIRKHHTNTHTIYLFIYIPKLDYTIFFFTRDAQKAAEEKQKKIKNANKALNLLKSVDIVWPKPASEVFLVGSFDGWSFKVKSISDNYLVRLL